MQTAIRTLHDVDPAEARMMLRHDYPDGVIFDTTDGFDVVVPQYWNDGRTRSEVASVTWLTVTCDGPSESTRDSTGSS